MLKFAKPPAHREGLSGYPSRCGRGRGQAAKRGIEEMVVSVLYDNVGDLIVEQFIRPQQPIACSFRKEVYAAKFGFLSVLKCPIDCRWCNLDRLFQMSQSNIGATEGHFQVRASLLFQKCW